MHLGIIAHVSQTLKIVKKLGKNLGFYRVRECGAILKSWKKLIATDTFSHVVAGAASNSL